ncbi:RimK family alpha-L-glutamate ligase [Candidatus Aenigmatarchaeota archaeon]
MKLAIIGPEQKSIGYTTKRLLEEAEKADIKTKFIPLVDIKLVADSKLDAIYEKKSLSDFDYILPRIDSKRAVVGYPVMRFLDELGINKPFPAESVLIAHNKFITLERLVSNNIPVPETYLTGSRKVAFDIIKKQKLPLMIKLLSGFGGMGVMVIESKEAAKSVIDTMQGLKQEILIEKFIDNPGEDIRGIVAGDEIIASFKRVACGDDKRANIKSGGRAVVFKLNSEMEELVIKSAEAIKSKICAVDMIQGKDGVKVIEANINPGLQGIEKATGINVAQRIIGFVKSEMEK